MTGKDVFRQALMLLNYTDANGAVDAANNADLYRRALPLVNQIYADLWGIRTQTSFTPLTNISQEIALESYVLHNVMPYGVAMLIAQTDGDANNQALYASLYNQRRSSAHNTGDRIVDASPMPYL